MPNIHNKKMTREEWREVEDIESQLRLIEEKDFARKRAPIEQDLDIALRDYMTLLDKVGDRDAALRKLDAALLRLRDLYREYNYDWDHYVSGARVFRTW